MKTRNRLFLAVGAIVLLGCGCATTQNAMEVALVIRGGALRIVLDAMPQRHTLIGSAFQCLRFDLVSSDGATRSLDMRSDRDATLSVTFENLRPGNATISISAFERLPFPEDDPPHSPTATASATASIVSGSVATASFSLQNPVSVEKD